MPPSTCFVTSLTSVLYGTSSPRVVSSRFSGYAGRHVCVGVQAHSQRRRRTAVIVGLGAAPQPPPADEDSENAVETQDSSSDPNDGVAAAEQGEDATDEAGSDDDILSSPVFLKKKLEVVQKELADAKAVADAAEEALASEKDSYVRLAADFDNYRRRSSADLRDQDSRSTAKVCKEILGVLDNFERAIEAVTPETEKEKSINSSYQAINKQLLDALVKLNVTPVEALGEPFDPEVHDAVSRIESEEYAEGVVSMQYQRGYTIGETLIRPAMVVVSDGPGPAVIETDAEDVADGNTGNESEEGGEAK